MGIMRSLYEELKDSSYDNVIDDLIRDEVEAIDGYELAKGKLVNANIPSEIYDKALKTFDHIILEEKEHIEELEELKELLK